MSLNAALTIIKINFNNNEHSAAVVTFHQMCGASGSTMRKQCDQNLSPSQWFLCVQTAASPTKRREDTSHIQTQHNVPDDVTTTSGPGCYENRCSSDDPTVFIRTHWVLNQN